MIEPIDLCAQTVSYLWEMRNPRHLLTSVISCTILTSLTAGSQFSGVAKKLRSTLQRGSKGERGNLVAKYRSKADENQGGQLCLHGFMSMTPFANHTGWISLASTPHYSLSKQNVSARNEEEEEEEEEELLSSHRQVRLVSVVGRHSFFYPSLDCPYHTTVTDKHT